MAATTPAAAAAAAHVVHIEAVQTAVPTRVVEPGRTRLVAVAAPPLPAPALQRRVRAVLYYRGAGGAAPGAWEDGVWVKESLSEALADHPEMAGRLRRRADGSWEVKLNDTGVRLLQATVDATLDEFLAGKGALARREAALAPWTDVNADDPDMCPPFFMQLTRFQGDGGYAVGVSLRAGAGRPADAGEVPPVVGAHARPHQGAGQGHPAPDGAVPRLLPAPGDHPQARQVRPDRLLRRRRRRRRRDRALQGRYCSGSGGRTAGTVITARSRRPASTRRARRLGKKDKVSRLSVVVVDAAGGDDSLAGKTTIETCTASPGGGAAAGGASLEAVQWSELGLEELVLRGSKPVHVSCSIVTGGGGDEGLVVVMPDDGAGSLLVMATLPK
ncbi:hypothetical protein OsJ_07767 [Oryza sativa Japonica Group]|uniref:Uncharacterized protein n=1 Tax=Oryza sativa subsp. japonica TaxID=39947 RepID=A3A9P7_ORYSJ|nr:hypothetical protein OsJ_07767 [Oryza sativa Japonica Group]